MASNGGKRPLTPKQVADLFNVHPTTVSAWADEGLIPFFRTPKGQRRFRPEDVERLLRLHESDKAAS